MLRDVRIDVTSSSAAALEEALAPCVSEAAVFVKTPAPEPVGDRVRVSLVLTTGEVALSIVGTVAWVFPSPATPVGRPAGMGILVEAGDDDSLKRLDRIQQRGTSSPLARIPGASFWRFSLPKGSAARFGSLDQWRREGALAPQQEWVEESQNRTIPMALIDSLPSDDPALENATARLDATLSDESDPPPPPALDGEVVGDVMKFRAFTASSREGPSTRERSGETPLPRSLIHGLLSERIHEEQTEVYDAGRRVSRNSDQASDVDDASLNIVPARAPLAGPKLSSAEAAPERELTPELTSHFPPRIGDGDDVASATEASAPEDSNVATLVTPVDSANFQRPSTSLDDGDVFAAAAADDGEDTDRTNGRLGMRGFDASEGAPAMTLARKRPSQKLVSGLENDDAPPEAPAVVEAGFEPSEEEPPPPRPDLEAQLETAAIEEAAVRNAVADRAVNPPPPLVDRAHRQAEPPEPVIHRMPVGALASSEDDSPSKRNRKAPRPKIAPKPPGGEVALADEKTRPRPAPALSAVTAHPAPELASLAESGPPDDGVFFDDDHTSADLLSGRHLITLDDEDRLPDLPTQTAMRTRPVLQRVFLGGALPRPNVWPLLDDEPPPILGVALKFSRVRDIAEKGESTMLEPLVWPAGRTARLSQFDTRLEEPESVERVHSPLIGDRIRIGGSFDDDDELGLDITDPTSLTERVGRAFHTPSLDSGDDLPPLEPANNVDDRAARAARALPRPKVPLSRFVPNALYVRVDGSRAMLFDVGTKVPARVARALPSKGKPVTVEILEGDAVIGDLLWATASESTADFSCELAADGTIFILVQDLAGQSLTARLETTWADPTAP